MRNVLKEISCTEYILQVIMNRTDLKVIDQTLQKDYKNLQGRSAILDCVAKDAENNHFNVEIQGENAKKMCIQDFLRGNEIKEGI